MSHYCGIDLHSNNHFLVVIDDEDKRVLEKCLNNDLSLTLEALSPYRETLQGIAVESTFNWYGWSTCRNRVTICVLLTRWR
jgi:hypothetical protein